MATKVVLSGSTDGALIAVAAHSSPGTVINTAPASVTDGNTITLYAVNTESQDRELTLEWGTKKIAFKIPAKASFVPLVVDLLIRNALVIKAFTNGAAMFIAGYVQLASIVPTITITGTLPGGTHAVSYGSHTLAGAGGTGPYTFSVVSGSLPTSLTLNASTGVVSGTPSVAATYDFTIRATSAVVDNTQYVGDQAYEVVIA